MAYKTIKKSGGTLLGILITMLIIMGVFFSMYTYIKTQTDASGITIPSKYNDTFNQLSGQKSAIDNRTNKIQNNIGNISEASNTFQVAWNGLKSLGNTLVLTTAYVGSGVQTTDSLLGSMDVVPPIVIALLRMGIIMLIVFIILSVLKGDPKLT